MSNRGYLRSLATLFAVGLAAVVAGCGDGTSMLGADGGRVRFVLSSGAGATLTDGGAAPLGLAPGASLDGDRDNDHHPRFQSANVTFSSILARNLDGELIDVATDLPRTVDVLALEGGNKVTLPDGVLPPATYDQIVVVMTVVQVVTLDGTSITIAPPGGGWTAIVPVCQFDVVDGQTTTVAVKFMLGQAFSWRDSRYHFKPQFTCGEG